MYATAKSCVMSDNKQSDFFSINMGVRQVENLSPVLFALFLNDMKRFLASDLDGLGTIIEESVKSNFPQNYIDNLLKLFLLLYADDTIIFSETPEGLQKGLTKVKEKLRYMEMKIKCR